VARQKLCHVGAIVSGKKTEVEKAVGDINKTLQREALFNGQNKTYQPYSETGERAEALPPENVMVQKRVRELLAEVRAVYASLWDLTLTQDVGNTMAFADVVVDGVTVLAQVPITNLMFLQKQLADLRKLVENIPTPDPAVDWTYDVNQGLLRSRTPVITQRTSKVPKVLVKFDPTEKHPGQAEVYHVDQPVGEWTKTLYSGCLPTEVKNAVLERVRKLEEAVKVAREEANLRDVETRKVSDPVFEFVFAPLTNGPGA